MIYGPMIFWRAGRRGIDALTRAIAGVAGGAGLRLQVGRCPVNTLAPYADGTPL